VAILDDKFNVLPAGQVGEVCIQGPNVTKGYVNNPKANEEAFGGERRQAAPLALLQGIHLTGLHPSGVRLLRRAAILPGGASFCTAAGLGPLAAF
jgi:acyl-CoA synthetase (AMP-forming)/AMP-acid ligase II